MPQVSQERIELNLAVLDELAKRLDGPRNVLTRDTYDILGGTNRQLFDAILLEDDDWQEIQGSYQEQLSSHFGNLVRFHDQLSGTSYVVGNNSLKQSVHKARNESQGTPAPTCINLTSSKSRSYTVEPHTVQKVLNRLSPRLGPFGSSGYQRWLARKLERRPRIYHDANGFEHNLPDYAALCEACRLLLGESLILYRFMIEGMVAALPYGVEYIGPKVEIFNHHGTTKALGASASAGCHLCSLLNAPDWGELEPCNENCDVPYFLQVRHYPTEEAMIDVYASDHADRTTYHDWRGESSQPIVQGLHWKGLGEDVSSTLKISNKGAPEIFELARKWLTCCLQHDGQLCTVSTRFQPSRLIKITTKNGSLSSARLVSREELPADLQYLTLSHCWGNISTLCLLESTLEQYHTQIPLLDLSKTFLDAFGATAWLGYEYI